MIGNRIPPVRKIVANGNSAMRSSKPTRWKIYVGMFSLPVWPGIPLVLIGGYFGYKFATELYHPLCGIMFLILWTFSPLILGWGATICPDVAAASFGIIGLYTFWHWLKKPTWKKAVLAGFCLGLIAWSTWAPKPNCTISCRIAGSQNLDSVIL